MEVVTITILSNGSWIALSHIGSDSVGRSTCLFLGRTNVTVSDRLTPREQQCELNPCLFKMFRERQKKIKKSCVCFFPCCPAAVHGHFPPTCYKQTFMESLRSHYPPGHPSLLCRRASTVWGIKRSDRYQMEAALLGLLLTQLHCSPEIAGVSCSSSSRKSEVGQKHENCGGFFY